MLPQSFTASNQSRTHLHGIAARDKAAKTQASGTEAQLYIFILALRLLLFSSTPPLILCYLPCPLHNAGFQQQGCAGSARTLHRAGEAASMDFSLLALAEPNYT